VEEIKGRSFFQVKKIEQEKSEQNYLHKAEREYYRKIFHKQYSYRNPEKQSISSRVPYGLYSPPSLSVFVKLMTDIFLSASHLIFEALLSR